MAIHVQHVWHMYNKIHVQHVWHMYNKMVQVQTTGYRQIDIDTATHWNACGIIINDEFTRNNRNNK